VSEALHVADLSTVGNATISLQRGDEESSLTLERGHHEESLDCRSEGPRSDSIFWHPSEQQEMSEISALVEDLSIPVHSDPSTTPTPSVQGQTPPQRKKKYKAPHGDQYFSSTALILESLARPGMGHSLGCHGIRIPDTIVLHGEDATLFKIEQGRVMSVEMDETEKSRELSTSWLTSCEFFPLFDERKKITMYDERAQLTEIEGSKISVESLTMNAVRRFSNSEKWVTTKGFLQKTGSTKFVGKDIHVTYDAGASRVGAKGNMHSHEPLLSIQKNSVKALCDRIVCWMVDQQIGSVLRMSITIRMDELHDPWLMGCEEIIFLGHAPHSKWGTLYRQVRTKLTKPPKLRRRKDVNKQGTSALEGSQRVKKALREAMEAEEEGEEQKLVEHYELIEQHLNAKKHKRTLCPHGLIRCLCHDCEKCVHKRIRYQCEECNINSLEDGNRDPWEKPKKKTMVRFEPKVVVRRSKSIISCKSGAFTVPQPSRRANSCGVPAHVLPDIMSEQRHISVAMRESQRFSSSRICLDPNKKKVSKAKGIYRHKQYDKFMVSMLGDDEIPHSKYPSFVRQEAKAALALAEATGVGIPVMGNTYSKVQSFVADRKLPSTKWRCT